MCSFEWPCYRLWMPAERAVTVAWVPTNSANMYGDGGVCVCVRACMCAHVCACVRMRAHACMHDVFAIYDNNICPRLIMIIFKIIILYFIQIRHTDDFPSTGTRLVIIIVDILYLGLASSMSGVSGCLLYVTLAFSLGILKCEDITLGMTGLHICLIHWAAAVAVLGLVVTSPEKKKS